MRRKPRPLQPDGIRQSYARELLAVAKSAHALVRAADFPALAEEHAERSDAGPPDEARDELGKWTVGGKAEKALHPSAIEVVAAKRVHGDRAEFACAFFRAAERMRADRASAAQRVAELLAAAKYAILQHFPLWKIERVLRKFAARTSVHQKAQLKRQVESAIGIPLDSVLDQGLAKIADEFVADNVALITSIPEQYFGQVEQVVLGGMKSGMRAQEMSALIEDRFGVAKSRAKLIARDQIGKFNADLNRVRQANVGVKRFVWRTVEDERVRESHAELDGGEFDWDNLPDGDEPDAYPGSEINCRCYSDPITDDV